LIETIVEGETFQIAGRECQEIDVAVAGARRDESELASVR
jgi:hypothetical protein